MYGKDKQKYDVDVRVIPPRGIFQDVSYMIEYPTPSGWLVCHDENGKYVEDLKHRFGKENNKSYQDMYERGDTLIIKLLSWLRQMKMRLK
jgi:hypothetical protein